MTSKNCLYYITLRCNDMCEFCRIWDDKELQSIKEASLNKHQENLKSARSLKAKALEVTGGEPLLFEELPDFLMSAKEEGFEISLLTNGILYPERAKEIKGWTDQIFFSLDYPTQEEHDRSRGASSFNAVLRSLRIAQELGEKPLIFYTITRDSIRFLPEMIELAEKLGIEIQLNPVYDFHGLEGFEADSLNHIRYYFKRPQAKIDLAALEFIKNGGNNIIWPRCRARETTVTFLPDGQRATPCFFNRGGKQGREKVCIGCTRWPYLLPSFSAGLDKYRILHEYSKFIKGGKKV